MNERYIPTKDLKTGTRVVGAVALESFKALKPHLERQAGKNFREFLRLFKQKQKL